MVVARAPGAAAAGAGPEPPSIVVGGSTIVLDGSPLPPDLTPGQRREAWLAAIEAEVLVAERAGEADPSPSWLPFLGARELWCTQSNGGYAGCAGHHDEPAIDIGMPVGTPVLAAGAGLVVEAGTEGGKGTFVSLAHADGTTSHYLHLSRLAVARGDEVDRGDRLGRSGTSGSSTAPHLHYEERGPGGRPRPIGVTHGWYLGRILSYPAVSGHRTWASMPYGTVLRNQGGPGSSHLIGVTASGSLPAPVGATAR